MAVMIFNFREGLTQATAKMSLSVVWSLDHKLHHFSRSAADLVCGVEKQRTAKEEEEENGI